jgi:CubicO group peptidase (beta-lactamase class C family)
MKQYIWDPLGMTSTGFRLAEHENIRNHLCATTARTPTGELVASAPYNFQNPVDDLGGGGLHSSPADYIKVLISLLKNDGTLLRPETVKTMFEPQLADPKHLLAMTQDPTGGPMFRGGVNSDAWNWGLGGILTTDDVEGVCKKGTLSWGGLPNLVSYSHPSNVLTAYAMSCERWLGMKHSSRPSLAYPSCEAMLTLASKHSSSGGLTRRAAIVEFTLRKYFHQEISRRWRLL